MITDNWKCILVAEAVYWRYIAHLETTVEHLDESIAAIMLHTKPVLNDDEKHLVKTIVLELLKHPEIRL